MFVLCLGKSTEVTFVCPFFITVVPRTLGKNKSNLLIIIITHHLVHILDQQSTIKNTTRRSWDSRINTLPKNLEEGGGPKLHYSL